MSAVTGARGVRIRRPASAATVVTTSARRTAMRCRPLTRETVVMRVAIVSDVHGNRHAFEAVLESIDQTACAEVWSLGDLVGYGADPDACVDLARERATLSLAGNHDLGVVGTIPLEQFSRGAAVAATWTRDTI